MTAKKTAARRFANGVVMKALSESAANARAAKEAARRLDPKQPTCVRCDGPHHSDSCRAPFSKLFPGQYVLKFKLKFKDGGVLESEGPVDDATVDALLRGTGLRK